MTEQRDDTVQGVCLAPEILAAYLDHRLTEAERSDVERHLAGCDECRELIVESFRASAVLDEQGIAAVGEVAQDPVEMIDPQDAAGRQAAAAMPDVRVRSLEQDPRWRRRVWTVGGGLLAAAAVFVLIVRLDPEWYRVMRGGTPGVAPLHERLVEAVGERRYVEPRLTGGFAYGPVPSVTRSAATPRRRVPPDIEVAILEIEAAAETDTSPALVHALGVAKLMAGDLDGAISVLDTLAGAEAVRPRVLADLSAAYLARSRDRGDPADVPRAIDAARRAVTADASLAEGWFNLALAREAAGERDQAREAWTRYLAVDKTSPWRAEAQRHLAPPAP